MQLIHTAKQIWKDQNVFCDNQHSGKAKRSDDWV